MCKMKHPLMIDYNSLDMKQVQISSDKKQRQQKILFYGLNFAGIQYSVRQSQSKIDIQCVLTMLDNFCRHLRDHQYPLAKQELLKLNKHITEADLPKQCDEFVKQKTTLIIEYLNEFLDEINQSQDQKSNLQILIDKYHKQLFSNERSIEQIKTALIKLLKNNQLQQALKLIQDIQELNPISDLIQKTRQYNFITNRHIALTIGPNQNNMSWIQQNISFNTSRSKFKSFIDDQYKKQEEIYQKLMVFKYILKITQKVPSQIEQQNIQFNTQFLKELLKEQYKQYQQLKWIQSIQQQFFKYQNPQQDYKNNKRQTKLLLLKNYIVKALNFYHENNNNIKKFARDLKSQISKISQSTIGSFAVNIDIDTNQFDLIDLIEEIKDLSQKFQYFKQAQNKLKTDNQNFKQRIDYLSLQNKYLQEKIQHIYQNKELSQKLQNRLQKCTIQKSKLQKQLAEIKSHLQLKLNKQQQRQIFYQSNQYQLSISENTHLYVQSINLFKSNIVKEYFGLLRIQIPQLSLKNFQRVFAYDSQKVKQKNKAKDQLLRNIQGKNHLLFIVKLKQYKQSSRIIIIYIHKQIFREIKIKSQISQIQQQISIDLSQKSEDNSLRNIVSAINPGRENQFSPHKAERPIQSSPFLSESNRQKQKDFIMTLWNKNKFVPKRPARLLKFNEKKELLFGENELIIKIESDYIYSVIGLKRDKVFQHHKDQDIKLLAGADTKCKFQEMEVYYYKQNNNMKQI